MGNIRNPLQTSVLLPGVSFANDMQLVVNGLPSNSETIRIEGQDSTGTLWKVYQQRSQTWAWKPSKKSTSKPAILPRNTGRLGAAISISR
jgi:hypothetical protein